MKKLEALVIGATGATGQQLVTCLLEDTAFSKVTVFVRRTPNLNHKKLIVNEIEFSRLEAYTDVIKGDVLFSCLGTTLKKAGSKDKQYLVDYAYQLEFAKIASKNKFSMPSMGLISCMSRLLFPAIFKK